MTLLVTGAARGIGRALVQAAADGGQRVIGTHRGNRPDLGQVEPLHRLCAGEEFVVAMRPAQTGQVVPHPRQEGHHVRLAAHQAA